MEGSMEGDLPTISRDELKQKIDRKDRFFLVETLAPNYYNDAHLPGAINLPPEIPPACLRPFAANTWDAGVRQRQSTVAHLEEERFRIRLAPRALPQQSKV